MSLRQTIDRLALTPWYTMCQLRPEFNTSSVGEKFDGLAGQEFRACQRSTTWRFFTHFIRLLQPLTWRMVYQVPAAVA